MSNVVDMRGVVRESFLNARDKGWHEKSLISEVHGEIVDSDVNAIASKLCLIHSEVSEALEDLRVTPFSLRDVIDHDGKPLGFPTELADICIRVFDLAGQLGIDIVDAILEKQAYNRTRPHRHGGKAL